MYNSNSIKNLISSDVSRLCLDEHDTSQAPGPSSDFQPKPTILCWSRHTLCNSYICVRYLSTIKGSSRGRHFSSSCWSPARLIRGSGSVLGSGRVFPRHNWKQAGPPPICQYLAAALEGRRNKRTRHNQDTGERVWPCFTELGLDHHLFHRALAWSSSVSACVEITFGQLLYLYCPLDSWRTGGGGTWSANYERWKPVK